MVTEFQKTAIRRAGFIGKKMQQDFPEIAQDRRAEMSYQQIVAKYDLLLHYGVTPAVAKTAVRYALEGYHGEEKGSYEGLMPIREEREELSRKIERNDSSRKGRLCVQLKKGIFALSKEELHKAAQKGGQKTGKRRGLQWTLEQGFTPWNPEERNYVLELAQQPEYQKGRQIHAARVAQKVNQRFYAGEVVRSRDAISQLLSKARKEGRLEERVF